MRDDNAPGMIVLAIIILAAGFHWAAQGYREMTAAERCARWSEVQPFTDCEMSKSCALSIGRGDRWREYVAYRSDTYDCP